MGFKPISTFIVKGDIFSIYDNLRTKIYEEFRKYNSGD